MARTKKRKSTVIKFRNTKTLELYYVERIKLLEPTVLAIMESIIPEVQEEISVEEVEKWFNTNPEAPVVVFSLPLKSSTLDSIQISVNARGVERELKKRGIGADHPDYELAYHYVSKYLETGATSIANKFISKELPLHRPNPWDEFPD